jgi:putative addiction module component (TIGR02574 family)
MVARMKDFGIDRLSFEDRFALMQEISESLRATPEQLPLTEEQKQLLDRRLADLDANPGNVTTWEEIKARVRGRE